MVTSILLLIPKALILSSLFSIPYGKEILLRTGEHLIIVTIAITIAIAIGIPLGILITRKPKLAQPILGFANAVQTIPKLLNIPLNGNQDLVRNFWIGKMDIQD